MKKGNVSYSVMYIKKRLRMIRLCNLQYEQTMQFAAQQTRVLLQEKLRWRSCKVCCAQKHSIKCNILKYLRKMKESAIKQVPLKDSKAIYL